MIKKLLLKLGLIKKAPPELVEKVWLDWKVRFQKYQKILLYLANHRLTRWVLGLHKSTIKRKIDKIDPSSVHWKTGKKYLKIIKRKGFRPKKVLVEEWKGVFFTRQRFAEALQVNLFPIFFLLHIWDLLLGNRFEFLPNFGCDTVLYYAGAGDGQVENEISGSPSQSTWDTCHDASAGTYAFYTEEESGTYDPGVYISTYYNTTHIMRSFIPFDTSSLPNNAVISAATLNLYITDKRNEGLDGSKRFCVFRTTQASPTSLTVDDYDQCGAIDNPTKGSNEIAYNNISTGSYQTWILNSIGKQWISKTGFTKLGMRIEYDYADILPAAGVANKLYIKKRMSEYAGTEYDPYLEITYTVVAGRSYGYIF